MKIRISKSEIRNNIKIKISKIQNKEALQYVIVYFCFGHLYFCHLNLFRVSCFEFRIYSISFTIFNLVME